VEGGLGQVVVGGWEEEKSPIEPISSTCAGVVDGLWKWSKGVKAVPPQS